MNNQTAQTIEVQYIKGELLVDSRLIAQALEIEHESIMKNIHVHLTLIERLGHLAFETATVTNSVGAGNTVKFAMLNEDQATFLMRVPRNTEAVVQAKFSLVKSFSAAKKLLKPEVDPNAAIALTFEKEQYRPWKRLHPEADRLFRSFVALPATPEPINPKPVAPTAPTTTLPDSGILSLIDTLSLAANRAGLAGNKSMKEAEFLDRRLAKIRVEVLEQQATIKKLQSQKATVRPIVEKLAAQIDMLESEKAIFSGQITSQHALLNDLSVALLEMTNARSESEKRQVILATELLRRKDELRTAEIELEILRALQTTPGTAVAWPAETKAKTNATKARSRSPFAQQALPSVSDRFALPPGK